MAVLGEGSQVAWSEELRENGRVVFTLRPNWALKMLAIVWLLVIAQVLRMSLTSATEGKIRIVFVVLFLAMAIGTSVWSGWRIFTRYPALTVDREGVRMGRNRFLPWAEVGTIGFIRGGLGQKRVPIVPKDKWAKELSVDQSSIKDIPGFARWLEGLLAEQRTAGPN